MRKRYLTIRKCSECSHHIDRTKKHYSQRCDYGSGADILIKDYCTHPDIKNREVKTISIPKWCPLPAKEKP